MLVQISISPVTPQGLYPWHQEDGDSRQRQVRQRGEASGWRLLAA